MGSRRSPIVPNQGRSSYGPDPLTEQEKQLFQEALTEALESSEIAATLDRSPIDEMNYLRELTTESTDKLWDEVTEQRRTVDSIEAELSRVRDRTRHPVGWTVQHLVTLPQLQAVLASAGLFLLALALALPFLGSSYGRSVFSRALIFLGLLVLAGSVLGGLVRLLRPNTLQQIRGVKYQVRNATIGAATVVLTIAASTGIMRLSVSFPRFGSVVLTVFIVLAGLIMVSSVLLIR